MESIEPILESRAYTLDELGLQPHNHTIKIRFLGRIRSLHSLLWFETIYLTLSLISIVLVLGLTIDRITKLQNSDPDFTFAVLLSWTTLFCFIYVLLGIFREQVYELLAFVVTIIIVCIYVFFNYFADSDYSVAKTIRFGVTILFSPFLIIGGIYLTKKYCQSKHLIYRTVGANINIQKACNFLFIEESLLKFDAQLAGSVGILWMRKGFHSFKTVDEIVVSIGSIVTFFWILFGMLALRYENKPLVYVFWITFAFQPSIIIWNLVRYYLAPNDDLVLELSVYLTGIIALFVRLMVVVFMGFVMKNFGKGLKQRVYGSNESLNQILVEEENAEQNEQAQQNEQQIVP